MEKISGILTGILLMIIPVTLFGQGISGTGVDVIEPFKLHITNLKTTNLIFPYGITSVDRGSKDVLAQKARGVDNILQIKAGRKDFEETNLTVITADGKLYSYVLNYSERPAVLNLQFKEPSTSSGIIFTEGSYNEAELMETSEKIASSQRSVFGKEDNRHGIRLQLKGLYVREGVIYFQIGLLNRSNIDYDLDQIRFFVRDRKKSKRTAVQEREIIPVLSRKSPSTIIGGSEQVLVFAFPKFTIPDQKYLAVQMMEKNGGRHLELKIGNPTIIKSEPINF
jgi:conjugative transposon TraN protein